MAKLTLGLDVDGVLVNYIGGFFDYLPTIGITPIGDRTKIANFDFRANLPELDDDGIRELIEKFSVTENFGRLEIYPGALEGIREIKSEFGDDLDIVAITSAGVFEETRKLRELNLVDFPFDGIHILPLGASKSDHILKLGKNATFVDDLMYHVQSAEAVGVNGVLYRQHYNLNDTHDRTMDDWSKPYVNMLKGELMDRVPIPGLSYKAAS